MPLLIYIISFLEGFTTLSIEIIAIRNFTPIIGTNSISTSIILGIILLALSYGYYIGGKNASKKTEEPPSNSPLLKEKQTITQRICKKMKSFLLKRKKDQTLPPLKGGTKGGLKNEILTKKIIFNLTIASAYYLLFTFIFDFDIINAILEDTKNYFFSILISSFLLFFIPVFYASQTIPLLSEILEGENAGEKIGKLLFFSTIGSFFGSVLTSTLLFSTIGVSKSATLDSIILITIAIILSIKGFKKVTFGIVLTVLVFITSLVFITREENIDHNILYQTANSYHNIIIYESEDKRLFTQNLGYSSGIDKNTKESFFNYIKEIKQKIIEGKYENIAIIGAAGFTLPQELAKTEHIKTIDVVDVDSQLKEISEKYFLEEKLDEKINFIIEPARYFLNNTIKKIPFQKDILQEQKKVYDVIVIDIYVGNSLPPQTLTLEFYSNLERVSNDIFINLITDKNLESDFSKNVFATMRKAFGELYYKNVNIGSNGYKTNFVITNKDLPGYTKYTDSNNSKIYTDDKNSIEIDLFKNLK